MVDVFISYARESHEVARRIADAVTREGYSVWWDEDLPPHLSYGDVITEKIGAAKAVIVIWSAAAAESEWVRAEADLARGQKKLIQTSIDGRLPPMPFNQIQFATIGDWRGEADHSGWKKVSASLAALCGESRPSTAPTVVAPPRPPPAPAGARKSWAVPAAIAGAVVLAAAAGGWWMMRDGGDAVAATETRSAQPQAPAPDSQAPQPLVAASANPSTARFTHAATIDDPDGFTNVRSGPSATFPVVARINQGEVFTTYPQSGAWWQVRTADSRVGFMAQSRIRMIDPQQERPSELAAGLAAADDRGLAVADASGATDRDPAQILPDSSTRRLLPADLAGLSPAELRIARNEIFARHGRPFRDPALRRHFERYSWYSPQPGPINLNRVEQANVQLMQRAEAK